MEISEARHRRRQVREGRAKEGQEASHTVFAKQLRKIPTSQGYSRDHRNTKPASLTAVKESGGFQPSVQEKEEMQHP